MYKNLNAEMAYIGMTRKELADRIGMKYTTLSDKLNGSTDFSLKEAFRIRDIVFPNFKVEYLFASEEKILV